MRGSRKTFCDGHLASKKTKKLFEIIFNQIVFRDLMEAFPDAKVVLTVRDNPEVWWKSVKETIYIFSHLPLQFHIRYLLTLTNAKLF